MPDDLEERMNAAQHCMLLAVELRPEYRDIFMDEFGHEMRAHGPARAHGLTIRWAIVMGLIMPFGTDVATYAQQEGAWG